MAEEDMHNWLELGLSADDEKFVREKAELYQKVYVETIDTIFDFARAIEILRKAHASSGIRGDYTTALIQYGFTDRSGGPMNKAIRSHFKQLLDNEEKVRAWWAKVDARKKRDWLSAKAIYTHWQRSLKPKDANAPQARRISDLLSPALTARNKQIEQLRARVEEVEQERDAARREAKQDGAKPAAADVKWTYDALLDLVQSQPKKTQAAFVAEFKRIEPELFKSGGKTAQSLDQMREALVAQIKKDIGSQKDRREQLVKMMKPLGIDYHDWLRSIQMALDLSAAPATAADKLKRGGDTKSTRAKATAAKPALHWKTKPTDDGQPGNHTAAASDGGEYGLHVILDTGGFAGYDVSYTPKGSKFKDRTKLAAHIHDLDAAKAIAQKHADNRQPAG